MNVLTQLLKNHIPGLVLILSIVVAWLLFPVMTGFPMIACAIFFIGLSTLIYVLKKDKIWTEHILYFGILTLSFFLIYRANAFLEFFDFLLIILFISILVRPLIDIQSLLYLLLSPLTIFVNTLSSSNIFLYKFSLPHAIKRKNYLREYALTIIFTFVVLLVTLPLLSSANPLFKNFLQQAFNVLNLNWLWNIFTFDSGSTYILRVTLFVFLFYLIPRVLSVTVNGVKELGKTPVFSINYLIPKIALAGILIVFFITQLQLYFATPELLQSLGYTNSRLTNEIFAQVTCVAFIVLLLAYLDKSRKKWNTRVTYFLLLEAFFLIGIAFKSVYDYSSLYGFTQKRLWGYTSMTWLTGALGTYTYHYFKQTSVQSFIKQMLAFSVVVILLINVLNFDYLIYHTAKPITQAGVDYLYISRRSVDAHYITEVLPKLMSDIQASSTPDESKLQPATNMIRTINHLRWKYGEKISINSFNFAEYQEYQATKHIDTNGYMKVIQDKRQQQEQKQKEESATPTPTQSYYP